MTLAASQHLHLADQRDETNLNPEFQSIPATRMPSFYSTALLTSTVCCDQPVAPASEASLLVKAFEALRAEAVSYCVLRGYDLFTTPSPTGDLDILVDPKHLALLNHVLRVHGFLNLGTSADSRRHSYLTYVQESNSWLKLDVITTLYYGGRRLVVLTQLTQKCLQARRWRPPAFIPAPDDEFFLLFLHCLIEKSRFKPGHRERLAQLQAEIANDQHAHARLSESVHCYLPRNVTAAALEQSARDNSWQPILKRRGSAIRHLASGAKTGRKSYSTRNFNARLKWLLSGGDFRRGMLLILAGTHGPEQSELKRMLIDNGGFTVRIIGAGVNHCSTLPQSSGCQVCACKEHTGSEANEIGFESPAKCSMPTENYFAPKLRDLVRALYHKLRGRLVIFESNGLSVSSPQRATILTRWMLLGRWLKPDLIISLTTMNSVHARAGKRTSIRLTKPQQIQLRDKKAIPMEIEYTAGAEEEVSRAVMNLIWLRLRSNYEGALGDADREHHAG